MPDEPTDEVLLAEAERQAAGEEPAFDWGALWQARCARETLEQAAQRADRLAEATTRGAKVRWPKLYEAFSKGELFGCQYFDFASMLLMKPDELDLDQSVWKDAQSCAIWAGEALSPACMEIKAFADTRLAMDARTRAKFFDGAGNFKPMASFSKVVQDSMEAARKRFSGVAEKHKWWWATGDKVEQAKLKALYSEEK